MTINRIPIDAGAEGLLDFTPVPRQCNRHDGWTPDRQRGFIRALAALGSVTAAAQAVNMAREGAYQLRLQDAAGEFRAAWAKALDLGVRRLYDVAVERAIDGVPVPVLYKGEVVAERRWHDNGLLMFLLRHRLPELFGALNPPGCGTARGGALNVRPEPSIEEVKASILAKLDAIDRHELRREHWTPEKLDAYVTLHGPEATDDLKRRLVAVRNPVVAEYPGLFEGVEP